MTIPTSLPETLRAAAAGASLMTKGDRLRLQTTAYSAAELVRRRTLPAAERVGPAATLIDLLQIGLELSAGGVCSDEASRNCLQAGVDALSRIGMRAQIGQPAAPTEDESRAIDLAAWRFSAQVELATLREFVEAEGAAIRKARGAIERGKARTVGSGRCITTR